MEVKSKVLAPLKTSCILVMLLVGDKDLPAPQSLLWALLRSDQGRAEEVTVNETLFPPSQRFSDLKERHYKAQRKGSI